MRENVYCNVPSYYSMVERHHKHLAMAEQGPNKSDIVSIFKRLKSIPANKVFVHTYYQVPL